MVHYFIQVVAFQLFFLLIYDVFLSKETFFNWNRAYLLMTAIISVILPFIKIESLTALTHEPFIVKLPAVIIGKSQTTLDPEIANYAGITIESQSTPFWKIFLFAGMGIMTLILLIKIFRLLSLYLKNPQQWKGDLLIIKLFNSSAAFSFFHCIFLGDRIFEEDKSAILEHETVHVKQRHSLDLLFFELMRIVFWFNPLAYMYQSRMATLHEYIADAKAVKFQNKKEYYNQLLSQVFETRQFSFVNPFFKQSLIRLNIFGKQCSFSTGGGQVKKRIVMLSQSKSKQRNIFKYALLLPLVAGMLFYVSCNKKIVSKEDPAAFNLSQFTHSRELGSSGDLSKEDKIKVDAFQNFLETHTNYVVWAKANSSESIITYSIHSKDEEIPKEAKKVEIQSVKNGFNLISDFVNYENSINKLEEVEEAGVKEHDKIVESEDKEEIVEIEEIEVKENDRIEVPFSVIDKVPTTKECYKNFITNNERKECMSDFISKHVNMNFNIGLASQLGLEGRQRINVIFKIDTDGKVIDVRSKAAHPGLEAEAIRIINTLPKFIPGEQKGKAAVVPYSLPIIFQVNGKSNNSEENEQNNNETNFKENASQDVGLTEVPFSVVEEAPRFKDCTSATNDDAKKCTSQNVANFVHKNFNTKLAKQNGLVGRQRINVIFKIDKQGNVINIRTRASSLVLEQEAIRVVGDLPKFTPGKHKGQPVVVPYSLPILFSVQ